MNLLRWGTAKKALFELRTVTKSNILREYLQYLKTKEPKDFASEVENLREACQILGEFDKK